MWRPVKERTLQNVKTFVFLLLVCLSPATTGGQDVNFTQPAEAAAPGADEATFVTQGAAEGGELAEATEETPQESPAPPEESITEETFADLAVNSTTEVPTEPWTVTMNITDESTSGSKISSKLGSWNGTLMASKYMAILAVVYIAVCFFIAIRRDEPIFVH